MQAWSKIQKDVQGIILRWLCRFVWWKGVGLCRRSARLAEGFGHAATL